MCKATDTKQCYIIEKELLIIQLAHYVLYAYLNIYSFINSYIYEPHKYA